MFSLEKTMAVATCWSLLTPATGAATKNEDDPKIKDSLSDEKTVKDASIVCQSFLDGVLIFF